MEGIKFVFIFTEGTSSEVAFINALRAYLNNNHTGGIRPQIELCLYSLEGNQGYSVQKINDIAQEYIDAYKANELLNGDIDCRKLIICDHDCMDRYGTNEEKFIREMSALSFEVFISKPNFEFFVLACLIGIEKAVDITPRNYEKEINQQITRINSDKPPGFTDSMNIPPYSKEKYVADKFMDRLFRYKGIEVMEDIRAMREYSNSKRYTQLPEFIEIIASFYESV
ncbi:MAG: hypothetical protein Q4C83_01330 [Candidatus Saccharibacteria bacterium]|nr:hypothetical protein [Candidatus Saccharibacteria bacterium]